MLLFPTADFGGRFLERLAKRLPKDDEELPFIIPEDEEDEDDDDDDDDDDDRTDEKRQAAPPFNPRQFAVRVAVNSALDALGNVTGATEACVRRVATSLVNGAAVSNVATRIQEIRQSLTTLFRIRNFLNDQRNALANGTFLDECVSRFIDIAFCSRCTESTPPLCFNACNALLRACYSPYYTALNEQYDRLWEVSRNVIRIVSNTVENIYGEADSFSDFVVS